MGKKVLKKFQGLDGRTDGRVDELRGGEQEGEEEGSITGGERDCSIISTDRVNVRDVNVYFLFEMTMILIIVLLY